MNEMKLTVPQEDAGKRIDSWLSEHIDGLTRSAVQNLLSEQAVNADGKAVKKNYKLAGGEVLTVIMPELREVDLAAEDIPLDIVYEDVGNWSGTLVNALMFHCGESLSGINGEHRPGIVHRIDKDTSGLLVVAKNDSAHQSLAAQIAAHTAYRGYEAIVVGSPREDSGTVDKPIARHKNDRKRMAIVEGGREAITHYTVLKRYRGYTHMAFQLETGRTHQIRVHMASIGHPIIGDPVYGLKKDRFSDIGGQCLHAAELTLTHPKTGERMTFSAALPDYFVEILQKLERMQ